jgi:DNA-binding MarR family transcriptional regulator
VPIDVSPSRESALVAARLRVTVGELVRATRSEDVLSPIPAAAMDLLDRGGPMTTADLAARRQVRHQTMAVTVKELLDDGYLASVPHAVDGRKKLLSLTAAGKRALENDREGRVKRLADAIKDALSDDERHVLFEALGLIARVTVNISARTEHSNNAYGPLTGDW